jgi:hypothetical protein
MKAKQINELKLPLEAKLSNKIYQVLRNQAEDVEKFYLTVDDIAINYKPEIIKEIRDGMRMTIAIFGYAMRAEIEEDLDIKFKSIDDLEEANKQIELDFALFIANESENQANLITASSNNEIKEVITRQTQIKAEEISVLIREQNELLASGGDKKRIATIEKIVRNAKNDIAKNIKINLLDSAVSRSRFIGERVIGITEGFARNQESVRVNNIDTAKGKIGIDKTLVAILDSKTRPAHAVSDGQTVSVDDKFLVGGEYLDYSRDPNGSIANTAGCRCLTIYIKKYY